VLFPIGFQNWISLDFQEFSIVVASSVGKKVYFYFNLRYIISAENTRLDEANVQAVLHGGSEIAWVS